MKSGRRFQNVFVLCTGRCGSTTFAKACAHFTNYTAGHETNREPGLARLTYPEGHIEVDNRLAWFLGGLQDRYGDDAFYVHLVRDQARVEASYDRRWHLHGSLIGAFDRGICMHPVPEPTAAADLVSTINANIRAFLRDKTHVLVGDIDDARNWFPVFADAVGAEGNLNLASAEFSSRHNATLENQRNDERHSRDTVVISQLIDHNKKLVEKNACLLAEKDRLEATKTQLRVENTQLQAEKTRLHADKTRLHAEKTQLQAEKLRLRGKLKKLRRMAWVLATPWIALAAPVALPALCAVVMRRKWRSRGVTDNPYGSSCDVFQLRGPSQRTLIHDAFVAHRAEGPNPALALLAAAGAACPPGAKDLFRAMAAGSDEEWLEATNVWAEAAALPAITLRPGTEPRFHRITLETAKPVLSHLKVSVIMPAFNAKQTIEQAARSILSQTWRNLELIIVDDCSSDGSAEIAERLATTDPRVRVLRNTTNVGPYVSKNRAFLAATGQYVTGHDADDIAIPTRIADQMQPIHDDPACVATTAFMVRLDSDGRFSYPAKIGTTSYDGIARHAMISLLIDRNVLISRLGFWDCVRFGADSEILARAKIVLGSKLREIRKVVMLCLNAEGSLTNNETHGISVWEGVSPLRQQYREAWTTWHGSQRVEDLKLPFPHIDRLFPAPNQMLVPTNVLSDNSCTVARSRTQVA